MLEILEYFGMQKRPLTVREVAAHFGYPHSSASVLVQTAAAAGYLRYDLIERRYSATLRLATLGSWVYETSAIAGGVLAVAQDVAARTNETVVIAVENDIYSQYVHVIPSTQSIQYYIPIGNRLLLCQSGTGWALLSRRNDSSIERVVERTRIRLGRGAAEISLGSVMARIAEVRRRGYAFSRGAVVAGGGMIAAPLAEDTSGATLVIGVASTLQRLDLNLDKILRAMRTATKQPRRSLRTR